MEVCSKSVSYKLLQILDKRFLVFYAIKRIVNQRKIRKSLVFAEYDITHITRGVELYNEAQLIQNTELYGNLTQESIIVAIQVILSAITNFWRFVCVKNIKFLKI